MASMTFTVSVTFVTSKLPSTYLIKGRKVKAEEGQKDRKQRISESNRKEDRTRSKAAKKKKRKKEENTMTDCNIWKSSEKNRNRQ